MIDFQPIQIPLVGGLSQKTDPRALSAPALAAAVDVSFDNSGGIQTRPPLSALSSSIYTAGGAAGSLADIRRIVANGNELLLFTKDKLYSYNPALAGWTERATHLAIASSETPRFATTADQVMCDRAQCQGVIVYAWGGYGVDTSGGSPPGTGAARGAGTPGITIAVCDKETGGVIQAPVHYAGFYRPRLVATADFVTLFYIDNNLNSLYAAPIDVTDPGAAIQNLVAASTAMQSLSAGVASYCMYDVVARPGGGNVIYYATTLLNTTTYAFGSFDASTATTSSHASANGCDGPIAVAAVKDGLTYYLNVVRSQTSAGSHSIRADLYNGATFASIALNTAISDAALGSPSSVVSQLTACYRDVRDTGSGHYRCYAFWSASEDTNPVLFTFTAWGVTSNWIDTAGTVGTANASIANAALCLSQSLASRAFARDGHVYVHTAFASLSSDPSSTTGVAAQVENTYFLNRDDARLCGKFVASNASGYDASGQYTSARGILPGVALVDTEEYAWCAGHRRIVPTQGELAKSYESRSPMDVRITFDDNRARRVARLGNTLYITGAEIMAWDGENLVECGFHIFPWHILASLGSHVGGLVDAGTHTYKATLRWDNAAGERERSTSAALYEYVDASAAKVVIGFPYVGATHKTDALAPVVVEIWRTKTNVSDPFYLVTSRDPSDTGAPLTLFNRFIPNVPTSAGDQFVDNLADATAALGEENEETEGVLERLAPPAATIICASDTRLFLAGIAGDPDRVWYSRARDDGQVASFNDALTIAIPAAGGAITALAILSESLVVFRERAIYVLPGEGFDNAAGGQNYGPARLVSQDCGALSSEAVTRTDMGIVFKSDHGWYLLSAGWQTQFIGGPVAGYDAEDVFATCTLEDRFQVRIVSIFRTLVWDYLVNQWCEWSTGALEGGAAMWNGLYVAASTGQPYQQSASFASTGYGLDIETPWIKLNDLAGRGKVRKFLLTGEWRSAHRVQIKTARDYQYTADNTPAWFETKTLTPDTAIVGNRVQLAHGPRYARCEAIKFRITVVSSDGLGGPPASGECLRLTGLAIEAGLERGVNRNLSAAQKG